MNCPPKAPRVLPVLFVDSSLEHGTDGEHQTLICWKRRLGSSNPNAPGGRAREKTEKRGDVLARVRWRMATTQTGAGDWATTSRAWWTLWARKMERRLLSCWPSLEVLTVALWPPLSILLRSVSSASSGNVSASAQLFPGELFGKIWLEQTPG